MQALLKEQARLANEREQRENDRLKRERERDEEFARLKALVEAKNEGNDTALSGGGGDGSQQQVQRQRQEITSLEDLKRSGQRPVVSSQVTTYVQDLSGSVDARFKAINERVQVVEAHTEAISTRKQVHGNEKNQRCVIQ